MARPHRAPVARKTILARETQNRNVQIRNLAVSGLRVLKARAFTDTSRPLKMGMDIAILNRENDFDVGALRQGSVWASGEACFGAAKSQGITTEQFLLYTPRRKHSENNSPRLFLCTFWGRLLQNHVIAKRRFPNYYFA